MRKRLITPIPQDARPGDEGWLDLYGAGVVEVTSEEKEYPVESALVSGEMRGWRAAGPGTQTIRLVFDDPQRLTRISLVFEETETESVPKSSSCDGLLMADARFEKLCGSSGILLPRTQYARWRNIRLNSQMSPFLNWSLCLTKVEEWLTPPSRT